MEQKERMVRNTMSQVIKAFAGRAYALILVLAMALGMMGTAAMGAAGDTPAHSKNVTSNGDGTYTLSLDVTGDADSKTDTSKANVVIVLDISGSMDFPSSTDGASAEYTGVGRYGLTNNGDYRRLYYRIGSNGNYTYYPEGTGPQATTRHNTVYYAGNVNNNNTPNYGDYSFSGTRYNFSDNTTRLEATKNAVKNLVATLLAQNSGNVNDMIEISYVTFSSNAHNIIPSSNTGSGWVSGTSTTTLDNEIDSTKAAGGTNWAQALQYADNLGDSKNDGDATYIVFFSDGQPTVSTQYNNYYANQIYNDKYTLFGIQWYEVSQKSISW